MEYQIFDRYEYYIWKPSDFVISKTEKLNKELNKIGIQGWELVTIKDGRYIFKRKLQCIETN